MSCTRIDFPDLAWGPGGHPLERKKACPDRPIVLLEFAPGFADPNWCERSHLVYVVSGTLSFQFAGGVEHFAAGQSCVIDAGTAHCARNDGAEVVVAFVASEIEVPA
jgi:quercetin dioxygenase-like cupin family protein